MKTKIHVFHSSFKIFQKSTLDFEDHWRETRRTVFLCIFLVQAEKDSNYKYYLVIKKVGGFLLYSDAFFWMVFHENTNKKKGLQQQFSLSNLFEALSKGDIDHPFSEANNISIISVVF